MADTSPDGATVAFNSSAYSYTPDWTTAYPFAETCERIARAGWSNVEVACVRPHAHPADVDDERVDALRSALDDAGLTAVHACTHQTFLGLNPASPDAAERAATVDHFRGVGRLCEALDVPTFHFVGGWTTGRQSLADAWDRAVATLDRAFEGVPDGVTPLVEPLAVTNCDLVHTPEHAMDLRDDLGHDVGVLLDVLNMAQDEIVAWDAVHDAAPALEAVHLADTDRRPPGDGEIDFVSWVDALDAVGFDGLCSVEVWGGDPDALARRSRERMRALLDGA